MGMRDREGDREGGRDLKDPASRFRPMHLGPTANEALAANIRPLFDHFFDQYINTITPPRCGGG